MKQIQKNTTSNGFIKLHRDVLQWEWYQDSNTKCLFLHCLLKANHTDKKWQGILIKRGSFITSYDTLAKELKIGVQSIRTSISKLKLTGELTSQSTSRNTLLIINNYNLYQSTNTPTNKQLTNDQQTTNKQLTTTKELKNVKNDKKIDFEDFYSLYPIKKSKAQALRNWNRLSETIKSKCIDVVNSKEFKDWVEKQDIKYIKHPSTWLSQGCWEDELDIKAKSSLNDDELFQKALRSSQL